MMRLRLLLGLMLVPGIALAAPVSLGDAVRIESQWLQARSAKNEDAIRNALREAARLPWPALGVETELAIIEQRNLLDPESKRLWAIDRALPMLAGQIEVSNDVLSEVLKEISSSLTQDETRTSPDMLRLQSAREAYASRRLLAAEARYAAVTKSSPLWPDALRERAWTLLLMGQPKEALGATVSLNAPYFPPEDHAEARLLKAAVLLRRCRFLEARNEVAQLAEQPVPTLNESDSLALLTAGGAPTDPVVARAWSSPLVARVRTALTSVGEKDGPAVAERWNVVARLGTKLFQDAFAAEAEVTREFKERALKVQYESFRGERGLVEQGLLLKSPQPQPPQLLDDDEVAWRFDGTFWRDELGTYRYSAGDACPQVSGR